MTLLTGFKVVQIGAVRRPRFAVDCWPTSARR